MQHQTATIRYLVLLHLPQVGAGLRQTLALLVAMVDLVGAAQEEVLLQGVRVIHHPLARHKATTVAPALVHREIRLVLGVVGQGRLVQVVFRIT
jgi:hypothetical protein